MWSAAAPPPPVETSTSIPLCPQDTVTVGTFQCASCSTERPRPPLIFPGFGFGRFLSDAVARGAAPFVLAGATGGRLGWEASGSDDPDRMVHEELPAWCEERGFDTHRLAAWGWSLGGYGVLRLAETHPGFVRAVAAFSPAVSPGDRVFTAASTFRGTMIGLWCGRQDALYKNVHLLEKVLPEPPVRGGYADGRHTRRYWNRITPAAFDFVAAALAA